MTDNDTSYAALDARLSALEKNMEKLEGSIEELISVLQQWQGAVKALKTLFYIVAPVVGALYWIKDHVKF